ncbi:hypothetical protein V462_23045 [Pantoea ananatis 15320]|nr:hypothetical protein V462_23045 [Pantoea ananatis 15320]
MRRSRVEPQKKQPWRLLFYAHKTGKMLIYLLS